MRRTIIKITICATGVFLLFLTGVAAAEIVRFKASLDKETIAPGRQTRLTLYFPGHAEVPLPEMLFIEGIDLRFRETVKIPSQSMGEPDSVKHIYAVTSFATGQFRIGPFSFEYRGNTYVSNEVLLSVEKGSAARIRRTGADKKKMDVSDRIYIEVDIPRTEVFVNENVPVTVRFYTDWLDVEDLVVSDDPSKNYITEEYASGGTSIIQKDDRKLAVLEFKKSFFVSEPGDFVFGPVKASYQLTKMKDEPLNKNRRFYEKFLGRRISRAMEITKDPIAIKVMQPPANGRPLSFKGAIGSFAMDAGIDRNSINEGDIVTLTVNVSGKGNYHTVIVPELAEAEGIRAYEPERVITDDGVIFKRVLKISSSGVREIPEIVFSFFDPERREYVSIRKGPIPITVAASEEPEKTKETGKKAVEPGTIKAKPEKKKEQVKDIVGPKSSPGKVTRSNPYFYRGKGFLFLQLFPLLLLSGAIVVERRLSRFRTDKAYAGWIRAAKCATEDLDKAKTLLRKKNARIFYDHIFRMMQRYLGNRLSMEEGGITEETVEAVVSADIKCGEGVDIRGKIKNIFSDCYLAGYTAIEFGKDDMRKTLKDVKAIIGCLNEHRTL